VQLEDLARYKVVAWYTDNSSASRSGTKFSTTPATGLRRMNSVSQLNTLAVYLKQQGTSGSSEDGSTTAIANGYWSRFRRRRRAHPVQLGRDERRHPEVWAISCMTSRTCGPSCTRAGWRRSRR
jgi:hypothetical protein